MSSSFVFHQQLAHACLSSVQDQEDNFPPLHMPAPIAVFDFPYALDCNNSSITTQSQSHLPVIDQAYYPNPLDQVPAFVQSGHLSLSAEFFNEQQRQYPVFPIDFPRGNEGHYSAHSFYPQMQKFHASKKEIDQCSQYSPTRAVTFTNDAATKLTDGIRRRCFNCCTTDTTTWRRSKVSPGKIVSFFWEGHI